MAKTFAPVLDSNYLNISLFCFQEYMYSFFCLFLEANPLHVFLVLCGAAVLSGASIPILSQVFYQ